MKTSQFISSAKENHSGDISKAWAPHTSGNYLHVWSYKIVFGRLEALLHVDGQTARHAIHVTKRWKECKVYLLDAGTRRGCGTSLQHSCQRTLPALGMASKANNWWNGGQTYRHHKLCSTKSNQEPNSVGYMGDFERKKFECVPI